MRTFKCPKCGKKTQGIMTEAYHRCPSDRNKMVKFEEQKDEDNG